MYNLIKTKKYYLAAFITLFTMQSYSFGITPYLNVGNFDPGVIDQTNLMQIKEYEQKQRLDGEEDPERIEIEKKKMEEINKLPNKEVSFILHSVSFKGNTAYTDEELLHLICDKINTEVTVGDLIQYCNLITDYYQQRGYLSSIAYMPPQKIIDGNVEIIITEGRYGNVTIEGNKWTRPKFIRTQFLKDNNIETEKLINIKDVQDALREINSSGYMQGSVELSDNEENYAYSDIKLNIKDRFPFDFDVRVDNQGRTEVGLTRVVLFAGMYNLTGWGDKLLSTTSIARHSIGQGVFYSIPLTQNETKLNLGYSYSGTSVNDYPIVSGLNLDMKGKSHDFFVNLSRRFIRTENYKMYGDISIDIRNTDTKSYDSNTRFNYWNFFDYYYKTRSIKLSTTHIKDDFYGKWFGNIGVDFGLPWFDASEDHSGYYKDRPGNNYTKFSANITRLQLLPLRSMAILQANGQWATRGLWAADQKQFGGISSVRGYQEGFLLGDTGITASAEVRFPIPFLGMILPEKLKFIDDSIRLAGFYDVGWISDSWSTDTKYLMSVGGGVVLKLTKYLSGNVYVGVPIGNKPDGYSNCRVHFTVTSNIL